MGCCGDEFAIGDRGGRDGGLIMRGGGSIAKDVCFLPLLNSTVCDDIDNITDPRCVSILDALLFLVF